MSYLGLNFINVKDEMIQNSQLHLQVMNKNQNSSEANVKLFKLPTSNNQVIYFYGLLALGVISSDTNFRICGGRVLGVEY